MMGVARFGVSRPLSQSSGIATGLVVGGNICPAGSSSGSPGWTAPFNAVVPELEKVADDRD
jgi:hypothetical protein